MTPRVASILIHAHYHESALYPSLDRSVREQLMEWARVTRWTDPIGEQHWRIELTPAGQRRVQFLLEQRGRPAGPDQGVAIEQTTWLAPQSTDATPAGFVQLAERASVPSRHVDDWRNHADRVIIEDAQTMIHTLSRRVNWEQHRDADALRADGWSDDEIAAWRYLDDARSDCPHSHLHIILWTH